MAGATLAGLLIALTGAEAVLLLDAATFCGSALLVSLGLRGLSAAEPQRRAAPVSLAAYRGELREGYAFLLRSRLLLGVVVMVMLTNGLDQGWSSVLLPVHAKENLGGAGDLGLLVAVFGGCALLGALLYGAIGHRFPRRALFTVAFVLCGLPRFVVAALTDGTAPLAATMAVGGLGAGMLNPILTTIMYERVPEKLRSRVAGVTTAGVLLTAPLGGLAAGFLIEQAGLAAALLVIGGAYFLTTLAPAVFPSWREMDTGRQAAAQPGPCPASSAADLSSSEPCRPSPAPEGVHRALQRRDGDQPQPTGQFGLRVGALVLGNEEDTRPVALGGLSLQGHPADRADLAFGSDGARTGDIAATGEIAAGAVAGELVDDAEREEQPGTGPADIGEMELDLHLRRVLAEVGERRLGGDVLRLLHVRDIAPVDLLVGLAGGIDGFVRQDRALRAEPGADDIAEVDLGGRPGRHDGRHPQRAFGLTRGHAGDGDDRLALVLPEHVRGHPGLRHGIRQRREPGDGEQRDDREGAEGDGAGARETGEHGVNLSATGAGARGLRRG